MSAQYAALPTSLCNTEWTSKKCSSSKEAKVDRLIILCRKSVHIVYTFSVVDNCFWFFAVENISKDIRSECT